MSSKLNIIVGPMFSGKTTRLIEQFNKNALDNIPTMVINYSEDNRYSNTELSSHDNIEIPCIKLTRLTEIYKYLNKFILKPSDLNLRYILINEGQFFPDLYDVIYDLLSIDNLVIVVSGLDGDYEMKKFGQILDIIPLANHIEKLNATCYNCKKPAYFTMRKTLQKKQIIIGSNDIYSPVCRGCHK
jgi:thymidine kinase